MNYLYLFVVTVSCIYVVSSQGEESVPCKVKFMGTACPQGRLVCEEDGDCTGVSQVCCYDGCGMTCQNNTNTTLPVTNPQPQVQPNSPSPDLGCPVVTATFSFCRFSTYTPCYSNNDCPTPGTKCCSDVCGKRCKFPLGDSTNQQQKPLQSTVPAPTPTSLPQPSSYKGTCPVQPRHSCNRPILYYCGNDASCMPNQRCCYRNCAFVCSRVSVVKSGYCPVAPTATAQMLGCTFRNMCYDDGDCPYNLKCCTGPCGKQCVGAVRQKVGSCGSSVIPITAVCYQKYDTCYKDSDCVGAQRCCRQQCGNKCQSPASTARPQFVCPPRSPGITIRCVRWQNECNIDSDCRNPGKKCCNTGCGNACLQPTSYIYSV